VGGRLTDILVGINGGPGLAAGTSVFLARAEMLDTRKSKSRIRAPYESEYLQTIRRATA
jgi:hypothetical protein